MSFAGAFEQKVSKHEMILRFCKSSIHLQFIRQTSNYVAYFSRFGSFRDFSTEPTGQ